MKKMKKTKIEERNHNSKYIFNIQELNQVLQIVFFTQNIIIIVIYLCGECMLLIYQILSFVSTIILINKQIIEMDQNVRQGIINLGLIKERIKPQILQTSHFTKSLEQLRFLLETKNKDFQNNKQFDTRLSVRALHELKNKGANIQKLERDVQYQKSIKQNQKQQKKDAEQCYFYIKDLNINNYSEFIVKNFEYSISNNIQYAMNYNQVGKQTKRKLIEKLRSKKMRVPNGNIEYQSNMLVSTASNKNQKIRKKYNTIIKQMIQSKGKMTPLQILKQIGICDKGSLINLVTLQFIDVDFQETNEIIARKKLMKNSIKIIEDEFARKISNGIELFLKVEYLNRTQFKKLYPLYLDSKNKPIWGLIYLLFRAGRYDDIKRFPHDQDCDFFFKDFVLYLQDEEKLKNRFTYYNQQINDLFLEQLYAILNNTQQLRTEIIFNNRQQLWLALKTLDIQSETKFNDMSLLDLQTYLSNYFIKHPNLQAMQNLLLSLNYDFAIKENTGIIEIDDRIHLAIVLKLYKFKNLLNPQFQNQYISMIKTYSQQMLQYDLQTAIYYTLMIHSKSDKDYYKLTLEALEQLLINHNKVEEYFGIHPKDETKYKKIVNNYMQIVDKEQYKNFINKVAINYQKRYGKYVYAALLYSQLLQNPTKSVECIIDLQINCILEISKPDINEKWQSKKHIQKYLVQRRVQEPYKNTLGFLEYYMGLLEQLTTKNYKKIFENLLNNNKYIDVIKTGLISKELQQMLNILNTRKGLKIYLLFLKAIIRAYQIYYSFKDDKKSYTQFFSNFRFFFKNLNNNSVMTSNSSSLKLLTGQITSLLSQKSRFEE